MMLATQYLLKKISRLYFSQHFGLKAEDSSKHFFPRQKDYLLYIHIPFCVKLCPYCSFFRVPFRKKLANDYYQALKKEILWLKNQGFHFTQIYFGGGTPTVDVDQLINLIQLLNKLWPIDEISLESNPNHLKKDNIQLLVRHGLKRLSVGVQTFDDCLLKEMNRYDKYGSSKQIQERIKRISSLVPTLNIDLIFGLPGQNLKMIQRDINIFKSLGAHQLSYYPLMGKLYKKQALSLTREHEFYQHIFKNLKKDFPPRSPWCFSKSDSLVDEYIISHEEYIGAGAGALSYLNGSLFAQSFNISDYIKKMNQESFLMRMEKPFSKANQIRYCFFSQLFGQVINWRSMIKTYGHKIIFILLKELLFFFSHSYIKIENGQFYLKPRGFFSVMLIMKEFFNGVNIFRKMAIKKKP